jgi:hypothetical protein
VRAPAVIAVLSGARFAHERLIPARFVISFVMAT